MLDPNSSVTNKSTRKKLRKSSIDSHYSAGSKKSYKTSQKEDHKLLEEKRIKLSPFYIASNTDLGFKNTEEKLDFTSFMREYMDATISLLKNICLLLIRRDVEPNEILISYCDRLANILCRRIDV